MLVQHFWKISVWVYLLATYMTPSQSNMRCLSRPIAYFFVIFSLTTGLISTFAYFLQLSLFAEVLIGFPISRAFVLPQLQGYSWHNKKAKIAYRKQWTSVNARCKRMDGATESQWSISSGNRKCALHMRALL